MNELLIVALITVVAVSVFAFGIITGKEYEKAVAVQNHVAHYECNATNGESVFVWNTK